MSRQKSGSIVTKNNKLYARLRFVDEFGKKRDLWRVVSSKAEAKRKLRELIKDSETKDSNELDAIRMTFRQLASFYETNYLQAPVYIGDRKISGLRQHGQANRELKILVEHFGNRLIQTVSYSDILQYKLKRLNTPTRLASKQRSIATVNRELQRLRRLFSVAVTQGWLAKSVFKNGDALINAADEIQRSRILSFEEEMRLLKAIDSETRRFHLKGIVLIALDCALRKNEILTLCRKDVDLINKTITVRALNSKTAKIRMVGMTIRVYEWLVQYCEDINVDNRLFPITSFKTAWGKVLKKAQIEDFHFHDCRHVAISRMIRAGIPPVEVMRVSGHSTMACLYRYANIDNETIFRTANALDSYVALNSATGEISKAIM
jgi:integrase